MISIEEIEKAKHIVIVANNTTFCIASALYTHILRLHKKVSFVYSENIDKRYSFLAWYDKLRDKPPSSADLTLSLNKENFFEFLSLNEIKPNNKMAQALYCALLEKLYEVKNHNLDGMLFARMDEMLQYGAEHNLCVKNLFQREPLSLFRLKAKMFTEMSLINEAQTSLFVLSKQMLNETGASLKDAYKILHESLEIVHVRQAVLLDEEYELIKIIEDR